MDAINTQPLYYSSITPWGTTAQSPGAGNWEFSHISGATPQYLTGTLKCTFIFSKHHNAQTAATTARARENLKHLQGLEMSCKKLFGPTDTKGITYNPFCTDF